MASLIDDFREYLSTINEQAHSDSEIFTDSLVRINISNVSELTTDTIKGIDKWFNNKNMTVVGKRLTGSPDHLVYVFEVMPRSQWGYSWVWISLCLLGFSFIIKNMHWIWALLSWIQVSPPLTATVNRPNPPHNNPPKTAEHPGWFK